MPVIIDGRIYYRTAETFRVIGISRNTLYRWLQKGVLTDAGHRDSRGWRLFTREEISRLDKIINSVTAVNQ